MSEHSKGPSWGEATSNGMEMIDIGMEIARKEFARRGNHSEVHLSEGQLAALIALGTERARETLRTKLREANTTAGDELRERLVEQLRWSQALLVTYRQWVAKGARASFEADLMSNAATLRKAGVKP